MLHVSNLHKRYGDVSVLRGVSFVVNQGERVGLIGPNGCGKTTLLQIVAGRDSADEGHVRFDPPDLAVGYLEQGLSYAAGDTLADLLQGGQRRLEAAAARVARLAEALAGAQGEALSRLAIAYDEALAELERLSVVQNRPGEVESVLASLGLGALDPDTPVAQLSGGQKTRLGLARLLTRKPGLLLLDEPTNHLDIGMLEWLEAWLGNYAGAVLIVSHDRTFLDGTVNRILDLDPDTGQVVEYGGNYSDYIETWERKREIQWSRWRDQEAEVRRIRQDIARTRSQAYRVEQTTTPGQPGVRRLAKKVAKKAAARERKLERYLASPERVQKPDRSWRMKLAFDGVPESGHDVLVFDGLAVGYGGTPLLSGIDQIVRAGERIALVGPNGSGKTTLLRAITGRLPALAGRIQVGSNVKLGYYDQEQEVLDPGSTPLETVAQVTTGSETDLRSFLHYFLFTGDAVFVPVGSLSYGERARLVLARLVAMGCNLLVLDEPINHLDIPSREMFEQAMQVYEGTVLAVVHDRYFIRRFASRIWRVAGGGLDDYLDLEDMARQLASCHFAS